MLSAQPAGGRLERIRDQLKQWRQAFEAKHGRPAGKPDIDAIPAVEYRSLKAAAQPKPAPPRELPVNSVPSAPGYRSMLAGRPKVALLNTCGRGLPPPGPTLDANRLAGNLERCAGSTSRAEGGQAPAAGAGAGLCRGGQGRGSPAGGRGQGPAGGVRVRSQGGPAGKRWSDWGQVSENVSRNREMLLALGLCSAEDQDLLPAAAPEPAPEPEPESEPEPEPEPEPEKPVEFVPRARAAYAGRRENFVRQNLNTYNKKISGLRKASGQGRAKRAVKKSRREAGAPGEGWSMANDIELIAVATGRSTVDEQEWDKACLEMELPAPGAARPLRPGEEVTEERLRAALKQHFGHCEFRPGQLFAIERTVAGQSSLIILPTGVGKSLCYQLPALFLPGLTLVVSPLISLMADQLAKLPKAAPGAMLTSQLTPEQSADVFRRVRDGSCRVLFVSPERFLSYSFMALMDSIQISVAVVDEVHCMSQWSHNFRPAYLKLGGMLRERLGVGCVLALTATATVATQRHITEVLQLPNEGRHIQAPIRENLHLSVSREEVASNKLHDLCSLLRSPKFRQMRSIIVYVAFKWQATELASKLVESQFAAAPYHAGLPAHERSTVYRRFLEDKLKVVVATVAFGMGIDKANVDGVVHYSMPKSIEAYVQEVGRAGRDMRTQAVCHTFLSDDDWLRFRALLHSDVVDRVTICGIVQALVCTKDIAAPKKRKRGQLKGLRHNMAIEQLLRETKSLLPNTKCVIHLDSLEKELDVRKASAGPG